MMTTPYNGPLLTVLLLRYESNSYPDLDRAMLPNEQRHFDYLLSSGCLTEIPDRSPRCYVITEHGREMLQLLLAAKPKHRRRNYSARNIRA